MYPQKFNDLVEFFRVLPGVGVKNAERYAFTILALDNMTVKKLANTLVEAKESIRECTRCHMMSEENECQICKNKQRNNKVICVVESVKDVIAIEKSEAYNGLYHVLGGSIAPAKGMLPDDLNFKTLLNRLDGVKEVIIATNPTVDGEVTSLYLNRILENKNILVTKLAFGLPMGGQVDYADGLTLNRALDGRIKVNQ